MDCHLRVGRRHDAGVIKEVKYTERLIEAQDNQRFVYKGYADRGYKSDEGMYAQHKRKRGMAGLSDWQKVENYVMKRQRIGAEWINGTLISNCTFLAFEKNLKIQLQAVEKYIIVGAIISITHTMLYGAGSTTQYWGLLPPTLEDNFLFN